MALSSQLASTTAEHARPEAVHVVIFQLGQPSLQRLSQDLASQAAAAKIAWLLNQISGNESVVAEDRHGSDPDCGRRKLYVACQSVAGSRLVSHQRPLLAESSRNG